MGDSPALWELGMGTHGLLGFSAGRSPTCQGVYGAPSCLLLLIITYYYLLLLIITYYYLLLLIIIYYYYLLLLIITYYT